MAYDGECFEMPCGLDAAAQRVGAAARRDGLRLHAMFFDGNGDVDLIQFFVGDEHKVVAMLDGEWHEWVSVDG